MLHEPLKRADTQTHQKLEVAAEKPTFPPEICALEFSRATTRRVLRDEDPRLHQMVLDLTNHYLRLLDDPKFRDLVSTNAWEATNIQRPPESAPLTEDLAKEVAISIQAQNHSFPVEFPKKDLPLFLTTIRQRVTEIRNELTQSSVATLGEWQLGAIAQMAKCLQFFSNRSVDSKIEEGRLIKPNELVVPSILEFHRQLTAQCPPETTAMQMEATTLLLALRVATLQHAGAIDSPEKIAPSMLRRLQEKERSFDRTFMNKVVGRAQLLCAESTLPTYKNLIERELPKLATAKVKLELLEIVTNLAYFSEINAAREWLKANSRKIESLLIGLMRVTTYSILRAPTELVPGVKDALLTDPRAKELRARAFVKPLREGEALFVHLMAGCPPRILEAVAATSAAEVTVFGDFSYEAPPVTGELWHLLGKAVSLVKSDFKDFHLPSLIAAAGSGTDIVQLEAAGAYPKPAANFIQQAAPEIIHALERHCGGPVAWIQDSSGVIQSVLLFAERAKDKLDLDPKKWQVTDRIPGIWRAISLRVPTEIAIAGAPPVQASLTPTSEEPMPVNSQLVVSSADSVADTTGLKNAATTPPLPLAISVHAAPSHTLPAWLVETLANWIIEVDQVERQQSSSVALVKEQVLKGNERAIVQRASQGKALSAGDYRKLFRLKEQLLHTKHAPPYSITRIPELREELAGILGDRRSTASEAEDCDGATN